MYFTPEKQDDFGKRLVAWFKRSGRPALDRLIAHQSRVGDPVVFDKGLFPWTTEFERAHSAIRKEAEQLLGFSDRLPGFHEVSPDQKRISSGEDWKTVWLYGFGYRPEITNRLCPVTSRLLDEVPGLQSALFSILAPGAHIPKHRGVTKGLINYHLGVLVPHDPTQAYMQIADHRFHWEDGDSYLFDDTNAHEVWNESEQARVVLFMQVERPLRTPGRLLFRLFLRILRHTPYVKGPIDNARKWEARLEEVEGLMGRGGEAHSPG